MREARKHRGLRARQTSNSGRGERSGAQAGPRHPGPGEQRLAAFLKRDGGSESQQRTVEPRAVREKEREPRREAGAMRSPLCVRTQAQPPMAGGDTHPGAAGRVWRSAPRKPGPRHLRGAVSGSRRSPRGRGLESASWEDPSQQLPGRGRGRGRVRVRRLRGREARERACAQPSSLGGGSCV